MSRTRPILSCLVTAVAVAAGAAALPAASPAAVFTAKVGHVADGDTIELTNGRHVRLVQIDTPEVYGGAECYGAEASAVTKRLLAPGTLVLLSAEAATDAVDGYGRLLRYVVRARDGLNVNLALVGRGAAAPYFYDGRRGRYAGQLARLALRARASKLGLWARCPGTVYDPERGIDTGPAAEAPTEKAPAPVRAKGGCRAGYSPCLPVVGDLDCSDIDDSVKPIHVSGSDPYRLDSDGDGLACE